MEKLKVSCVNNEGGYEEYKADITKYMSEIFDNVKSAFVFFFASDIEEAKVMGRGYFTKGDHKVFNYDGRKIEIEFSSGKTVVLHNSEWGSINLK